MKLWTVFLAFSCAFPMHLHAESESPPFKMLRYEEDYSYLRNAGNRADRPGSIKHVRLSPSCEECYASLGGEVRWRFESFSNPEWGMDGDDESYLLQRYMLHGDFHFGATVRAFLQLRSAFKTGGNPPDPIDEDTLDLQQGFFDLKVREAFPMLVFRTGRQEFLYGSTRLVSAREGPNIRRSFDGFKMIAAVPNWRVDLYAARPVAITPGIFNDKPTEGRAFWGAYVVHSRSKVGGIDLFYLGLKRDEARFNQGVERELRHTAGFRFWGIKGYWDYDFEVVYQFGTFGDGDISAWMGATNSGYTFQSLPLTPRLGLKVEAASGDKDAKERSLQTFNPMFSNPSLINETDHIGLSNIINLHPYLTLNPWKTVRLTFDWAFFWRQSTDDAIYDNVVRVSRRPDASSARYVGSAAQGLFRWQASRHWLLSCAYARFFPGPFIRETGPDKPLRFLGSWATYKF